MHTHHLLEQASLEKQKVALVHDWLSTLGGGESVLQSLCTLYQAPIYTLFCTLSAKDVSLFANHPIYTTMLQHLPHIGKYYRYLLPFFPKAIASFDLSGYDLIISSSHCVAKGIKKPPNALHICYCHTPMRYAWDLSSFHLQHLNPIQRKLAKKILERLQVWDVESSSQVDVFIANSHHVAKRIQNHYGRSCQVIYPPVDTDLFVPSTHKQPNYVTCCRLVPYKRIDLLVEAFNQMPDKHLVIIGEGPEKKKLQKKAKGNIDFRGRLSPEAVSATIAQAKAFVFAAEEDFGIALVEAQAAGVPVIAYGVGGSLETVIPGKTGLFFLKQTAASFIDALHRFEKMEEDFQSEIIREHALTFSTKRFQKELQTFVAQVIDTYSALQCDR